MTVNTGGAARTLFVGGPRHGTSVACVDTLYVDVLSSTQYRRENVSFTTAHPKTNRPEWTYDLWIYVHETVTDMYVCTACNAQVPANHAQTVAGAGHLAAMAKQPRSALLQQALLDAAGRRLFFDDGVKRRAEGVLPPAAGVAAGNGAGVPAHDPTVYIVACKQCNVDHSFPNLKERAEFATGHLELNPDHELTFDVETLRGTDPGNMSQSDRLP